MVKEGKEIRTALLTTASVVALSDFFFFFPDYPVPLFIVPFNLEVFCLHRPKQNIH